MGRWTGSQLKNIMTTERGKGKMSWDNFDKLFSFGDTALKYIYENAMERKTGRYIDQGEGTIAMRYGSKVEPLIVREFKRQLKKIDPDGKYKDVGFITFSQIPKAGVSADGKVISKKTNKVKAPTEFKACTNWQTHYDRTFEKTTEKSKDFWQIQGECLAYNAPFCYYASAEPPHSMAEYVFYDGNILDLEKQWRKECKVTIEKVYASKEHQEALLKRIVICEDTLKDWLKDTSKPLREILDNTITKYENEPERFDAYILPEKNTNNTVNKLLKKLSK